MSKKKLIDAEQFTERLKTMSQNLTLPQIYDTTPSSTDPISQAIYCQLDALQFQMNNNLESAISQIILEISLIAEDCIYQDYPCRLCEDVEDDPIENFGDIRSK